LPSWPRSIVLPNAFVGAVVFIISIRIDSAGQEGASPAPYRVQENQEPPYFEAISQAPLRPPPSFDLFAYPPPYPVGRGSATIGGDARSLEIGLQRSIERKLKWPVLSLIHWVSSSGAASLRSNPHEWRRPVITETYQVSGQNGIQAW
jgi:hypothetical protein